MGANMKIVFSMLHLFIFIIIVFFFTKGVIRNLKKKSKFVITLLILLTSICSCKSSPKESNFNINKSEWKTNHTFVFVHGLSGWGHYDFRNKFFPYWGMGNGSLMKELKALGFNCVDASVAPQGSAWDRVCELYAQLTGSIVDYGEAHSKKCGHPRYGKSFKKNPLIKNWDEENKISLLGHSFGGVTVRLLTHLMVYGNQDEIDATPENELSPLFKGGHNNWIYSVTTLAAPHNGTSAYHIPDPNPTEKQTFSEKMMAKTNAGKLDGRALFDYAAFDMHIQNAKEINKWLKTSPNAYYFSFACSATYLASDGTQKPIEEKMEKLFQKSAIKMGQFEGISYDGVEIPKSWQENDGLVNTVSALVPDFAPNQQYDQTKKQEPGIWNVMPVYKGDHMSLQGGMTVKNPVVSFYAEHLQRINKL